MSRAPQQVMLPCSIGGLLRQRCREGLHTTHTAWSAPGQAQCNLVVLPSKYAYDFLLFCQRNPKPCPLLEVTDTGRCVVEQT